MPTLKEMVQEKRAKILMFVILLLLGVYIGKVHMEDVPDISYFSSDTTAYCLAGYESRNSGIAWVHPINAITQTESQFYPTIKSAYNTDFMKPPPEEWLLENWQLSDWRSFDTILDTRWESLKTTISKGEFTHTSDASFHIKKFPLSFSVLSSNPVEILLCEGWKPQEFPSYYIVISSNEVMYKKIKTFTDDISQDDMHRTFKADLSLLSGEAWKSYHLAYDEDTGDLELRCIIDNKYVTVVKVKTTNPLKPLYFLTRTKGGPAMWKIEERRYLYTTAVGNVSLGPKLQTLSDQLCVSMYVALCDECTMQFYIYDNDSVQNVTRKIVANNEPDGIKWKEIRLLMANKIHDNVQFHISTDFTGAQIENSTGFWALDEVRVCTRDEIKISTLKSADLSDRSMTTCQSLNHPRWRPKREEMPPKPSFSELGIKEVTSTSTTFRWQSDVPFMHTYMYNYKATKAKQCNTRYTDKVRSKSNGYVLTPSNEVHFNNLIPYTFYDIKITEPIYNSSKVISLLTSETDLPTEKELPQNVLIKPGNVSALITWDKLNCTDRYGPLVFQLRVMNESVQLTNTYSGTESQYNLEDLQPNSEYTVQVVTSRSENYMDKENLTIVTAYNFYTLPGIAPDVVELEAYSASTSTLDLRFKIPWLLNGQPIEVNTNYCIFNVQCASVVSELIECPLRPEYYCVHLEGLLPDKEYHVHVSLRNNGTDYFGSAVKIEAMTRVTGPAAPTNLTYEMVDCGLEDTCHLLLTWKHPEREKSPIDYFEIILQEQINMEDNVVIKEMHKIEEYEPEYSHQIRYIPYSTTYNISVTSANYRHLGEAVYIMATTDNIGLHLDQEPKLLNTSTTQAVFTVPVLDERLKSFLLIAIVQDFNGSEEPDEDVSNITEDALCSEKGKAWIAAVTEVVDDKSYNLTIGNGLKSYSKDLNMSIDNVGLKPATPYCVIFVIRNRHHNKEHVVLYYNRDLITDSLPSKLVERSHFPIVLVAFLMISLLLVLIGVVMLLCRYWNKRKFRLRQRNNGEPVYMSLESLPHAVANNTYDVLRHNN